MAETPLPGGVLTKKQNTMSTKTVYRPIYEQKFVDGTKHEIDHPEINFSTYESAIEHGNTVAAKGSGNLITYRVKYVAVFPVYGEEAQP